jgi:MFS family permease
LTGCGTPLKQRDFLILLFIFFIGLGLFNAVTTWIEDILRPRGFSITQAGIAGGLMIVGGVVGALVMPSLSDRYRRRVQFIVVALVGALPGVLGVAFATEYWLLLSAAFVLGFFLLSSGPIGFQYGAEITRPTPEGTSNGLLLWMGQVSGIAFILAMDALKDPLSGSMTPSLIGLTVLLAGCALVATRLRETALLAEAGGPRTG